MKITGKSDLSELLTSKAPLNTSLGPEAYLDKASLVKLPRRREARKAGSPGTGRLRLKSSSGAPPAGKRSRPETPLHRWNFVDGKKPVASADGKFPPEVGPRSGRSLRGEEPMVSARKLAAGLWRLQLQREGEMQQSNNDDRLGFRLEPLSQLSYTTMEEATKWNPISLKPVKDAKCIHGQSKPFDEQIGALPVISMLKKELKQSEARIHELETEQQSSKKKLEHFLRKLGEERATWKSREHEKIRVIVEDMKAELKRERKNRHRMEIVNSKLVNELADAKLTSKHFMQDYEKERKARVLMEEVCDELANEVGEEKAEFEALKRESLKYQEEVDEERKMLQLAEVWREERVQMKLVDAKVTLEEKYSQMSKLISELEVFLSSKGATTNMEELRKAEYICQAATSVNIQDIEEFTYEPPNSDNIFSIFEDATFSEDNEKEIDSYVTLSPDSRATRKVNKDSVQRPSNDCINQNGDIEDESGWETVSHPEDQGSNYSFGGSDHSVYKIYRDRKSSGSGTEWEEEMGGEQTPITEISEVWSVPKAKLKDSSTSQLWRSCPRSNEMLLKTTVAEGMNGHIISPDHGSSKSGLSPPSGLVEQWTSPGLGYPPHITRGMKGCIEWPRSSSVQKNSLKTKLLEAHTGGQKIQVRHILNQKI